MGLIMGHQEPINPYIYTSVSSDYRFKYKDRKGNSEDKERKASKMEAKRTISQIVIFVLQELEKEED